MKSEEPFLRTARLLGDEAVEKLQSSSVTIVGLGAVGGYALEALVRLGVGTLRLFDFDVFSPTNLNRQILATRETIGRKKCQVAAERALAINPHCNVEIHDLFVDGAHMEEVCSPSSGLVVDAIDSLKSKCDLLSYAYFHRKPIVSSMGAALRRDPSHIHTGDLMETQGCPLARAVRQEMRRRGVGKGIDVVYSDEVVDFHYRDVQDDPDAEGGRRVLGSLVTITGIFGLTLGHLAMEKLLGEK